MAPRHGDKSPGKIWYGWQKTKALLKTFSDGRTKKDAAKMSKWGGFSAGSLGAVAATYYYLPFIPLLPLGAALVGVPASGYYGWQAWQKSKALRKSSAYADYIRTKENEWLKSKSRPSLWSRIKSKFKRGKKDGDKRDKSKFPPAAAADSIPPRINPDIPSIIYDQKELQSPPVPAAAPKKAAASRPQENELDPMRQKAAAERANARKHRKGPKFG